MPKIDAKNYLKNLLEHLDLYKQTIQWYFEC